MVVGSWGLGRCLLCSGEGQSEVLFAVCWVKCSVVKSIWEEFVDESTEGHATAPAGGEILDVHMLGMRKRNINRAHLSSLLGFTLNLYALHPSSCKRC